MIALREDALNYGRRIWADYVFVQCFFGFFKLFLTNKNLYYHFKSYLLQMMDADVFLTNPNTFSLLISKNKTVLAPMLKSDGMYSNFWAGMTSDYYYERTERYTPILNRENTGCHEVPMIHSAVLIDLKKIDSDFLTYKSENLKNYDGPRDDIITFALAANASGKA